MSDDRRGSQRKNIQFRLVYDDGASFNAGAVHDVSEGGLFLETPVPLDVGTEVTLTPLDDAGDTLFEVRAKVVRKVRNGMGLQFVDLADEDRDQVVAMIKKLESSES